MPNVVLIHTHDTGRYIQPYGSAAPTPNLQRLAEGSVLFRHAYCAGPTCSPSRGAMLSGMSPHANGLIGLAHLGFSMDDYSTHLASYLRDAGYDTVLAGLQHEASGDESTSGAAIVGYDRTLEHGADDRDEAAARASADYLRSNPNEPFFLSIGLFSPHRGFHDYEHTGTNPAHLAPPAPLPDVPSVREEMAGYYASVRHADECIGIVLDALDHADVSDDTLVVYTTDHGIPFGNMKCSLYDSGIGVAQIVRFPDGRRAGETIDALVSHVDLVPSICSYLNLPIPKWVEGTSWLPLVDGDATTIRDAVFAEVTYHAAYEPMRCIRTDRYKFIKLFDPSRYTYVSSNFDSRDFYWEHGLIDIKRDPEMLFDLYHDPNERRNLIEDPDYQNEYDALSQRLRDWMDRTDDPLLSGPVPKPPGATAYTKDGYWPSRDRSCQEPADARTD